MTISALGKEASSGAARKHSLTRGGATVVASSHWQLRRTAPILPAGR